jgi:hypothetical protein
MITSWLRMQSASLRRKRRATSLLPMAAVRAGAEVVIEDDARPRCRRGVPPNLMSGCSLSPFALPGNMAQLQRSMRISPKM